jgi:hypothetical protein
MNKKRFLVIVGIVAAAVALSILLDTMLANHRPAITSLKVEPERVLLGGSCQIVCNATDVDGDELSYEWWASGGEINGEGATVTWAAPESVGSYNVTVTVTDGRDGEVTNQITITVRANRPPTIATLTTDAIWALPSGSLQVTCNASDPDGDELSYEWTATAGNITGTGAAVNWTAPQEVGVYNITVVVSDGYGGSDTRTLLLSVVTGQPPIIEDLIVTAREPKYLKKSGAKYIVGRTKQDDIECIVSDTNSEVSYDWSCEDGEISGEGSMITWTAPDETLTRTTVTVIVSDITGNKVSKSIVFQVASCNSCTFG